MEALNVRAILSFLPKIKVREDVNNSFKSKGGQRYFRNHKGSEKLRDVNEISPNYRYNQ